MSLGHYAVLKVARDASGEDIRKSYRRLSQEWHLRQGSASGAERAQIDAINAAYKVLSDEQARAAYDQEIAANGGKEPEVAPAASQQRSSNSSGAGKAKLAMGAALAAAVAAGALIFGGSGSNAPTGVTGAATVAASSGESPSSASSAPSAQAADSPELLASSLAGDKRREDERLRAIEKAKEEKAKEEKAKEEKAKEEKAKEEKAKEDKAKEEKAKDLRAKEDRAREEQLAREELARKAQASRPAAPKAAAPAPAPTAAPSPVPAPAAVHPAPSAPARSGPMPAAVACPKQVVPEMPKVTSMNATQLPEADVRAQVTIQGGSVRDVKILSGPKVYHGAVISAVRRYGCVNTAEAETFLQEFHFNPPSMD